MMGERRIADLETIEDVSIDDKLIITSCGLTRSVTVEQLLGIIKKFSCPTCGAPKRTEKVCGYCRTRF